MVIDNADDIQLFGPPGDLAKWIPECAHGSILVTTRDKAAGSRLTRGGSLIEVGKMSEREAGKLLRKLTGTSTDLDPEAFSSLASRLEQLPLAIVQAAAFIQDTSISVGKYLQILGKSEQHLIDLLSQDFEIPGTNSAASRRVTET